MGADDHAMTESVLASARALVGMAIRTVDEGPMPLTLTQHRVLLLLEDAGGLSVNQVADRLGVNQSNASRHCTRLTELGLVDRRAHDHDGRTLDLRLTQLGRRQVRAVREARHRWAAEVLAQLPDSQARDVVRGLRLLATAAESLHEPETSPLL
jgi:DNA-binding MarR family transcriptional regulator